MLRVVRAICLVGAGALLAAACGLDTAGEGVTPSGDGGVEDAAGGFDGIGGECFVGAKVCDDKCIPNADPATGCGGTSCEPCNIPNATAKCSGDLCDLDECDPGFADCSSGVTDGCETNLSSNPLNCGACGNDCTTQGPTWIVCKAGECKQSNCPVGEADCDLDEVCETNIQTDVNNCGLCGIPCKFANASAECVDGKCVLKKCDANYADCDGDPKNGCEVNTQTDTANCNGCGNVCQALHAVTQCKAGKCTPSCQGNWGDCDGDPDDGCETNLTTTSNCGGCGTKCTSAPSGGKVACISKSCSFTCNSGLTKCGSACVNTSNNVNHCNGCNNKCSSAPSGGTPACIGSACTFTCTGSLTKCGSECVNTTNNVNHCNGCNNKCTSAPSGGTPVCQSSACTFTCTGSLTKCGSECVNTTNNVNHCGQCDKVCPDPTPGSPTCSSSTCGVFCGSLTNCSGTCVNTNNNLSHCGGCDQPCNILHASGHKCSSGQCDYDSCHSGWENCDSDQTNGCETQLGTNQNCSGCGDECKNGKTCQGGSCKN